MNRRTFFSRLAQAALTATTIPIALRSLRAAHDPTVERAVKSIHRANRQTEIVFRTRAELAGAIAFLEGLNRQIAAAKVYGAPFENLQAMESRWSLLIENAERAFPFPSIT